MAARFLVSIVTAALLVFAGAQALATAVAPPPLKIIATVVAHPHPYSAFVARESLR
ncbi:MAG TPA: hypothetical protein VMD47_05395 [Candidatus Acidoferrales bacterium]|nr:hypothetical protein [Candidatus Acidoferrales bacterium]